MNTPPIAIAGHGNVLSLGCSVLNSGSGCDGVCSSVIKRNCTRACFINSFEGARLQPCRLGLFKNVALAPEDVKIRRFMKHALKHAHELCRIPVVERLYVVDCSLELFYSPATVMPSIRRVGHATEPRNSRSLPISAILLNISPRLPATVISSTGNVSSPSLIHKPEAPREKSPVTRFTPKPRNSVT